MKKILLLILGLLSIVPLHAQTNIAVLADPHVMGPGLLVSNGSAWKKALDDDRKLLDYSKEVFDVVVNKLLTDKPDLVLIVGDLTKDGELLSHQYVVKQLDKLRQSGVNTLVIPGNHDLGTVNSLYYDGSSTRKADVASASKFASLYKNYGYGSGSTRDPNSLSYSCEPIRGLVVIGIDTGTSGSVSSSTLNWVCNQVKAAYADDKQVIVMMHHLLFPHFVNEEDFMKNSVVSNYETVRNRLADAGVRVVLTGHVHISDIARDYNADLSKSIYDIATGSPISYPCDYRRMTLSADRMRLQVETEHVTSVPSNANYGKTAKSRLLTTMRQWARERYNQYVSDIIADAYIVHAEGNEAASRDASNILSQFNAAKSILSLTSYKNKVNDISNTVNSMLQDYSNYGVKNRQDRTNDLTLTIEMPKVKALAPEKVAVSVGSHGRSMCCFDKDLDFSDSEVKAYIATGCTDHSVIFTRITDVPAGTPVMISGSEGKYEIPVANSFTYYPEQLLKGNATESIRVIPEEDGHVNMYLSKSEGVFVRFNTEVDFPAGNSYLHMPVTFNPTQTGASEIITLSEQSKGKASYCPSVDLNFTSVDGLRAYVATSMDKEGLLKLTRVNKVQAGTPLLLKGEPNTTYVIPSEGVQAQYSNLFNGSAIEPVMISTTTGDYTNYYLNKTGSFVLFESTPVEYPAGKSYLQIPTWFLNGLLSARIRSGEASTIELEETEVFTMEIDLGNGLIEGNDNTTGIKELARGEESVSGEYYNLQGQRVKTPDNKGLYIKDGRKMIVR